MLNFSCETTCLISALHLVFICVLLCFRGLLSLMNEIWIFLCYVITDVFLKKKKKCSPWSLFLVRRDTVICTMKKKKGPPAVGVLQYLLSTTSALFSPHQPLQNTTHALPLRTSNLYKPPPHNIIFNLSTSLCPHSSFTSV